MPCLGARDTLTTPHLAAAARRHKIINAWLACTGAAAVWGELLGAPVGTMAISWCFNLCACTTVGECVMPVASDTRFAAQWLFMLIVYWGPGAG